MMPSPNPQNPLITSACIRYSHFPGVIAHSPDRTNADTHSDVPTITPKASPESQAGFACHELAAAYAAPHSPRQMQMLTRRGTPNRFAARGKGGPIKPMEYSSAHIA